MTMPPPIQLPDIDPWMRHSYMLRGLGGGQMLHMNQYECEREKQRPWYRRLWGLPSQDEVDSWDLQRPRS
jgi:hypothetical protein